MRGVRSEHAAGDVEMLAVGTTEDLLKALGTTQVVADQIRLLNDLSTVAPCNEIDAHHAIHVFTKLWKKDLKQKLEYRTAIISAARSQVSFSQGDAAILKLYIELSSAACIWCTRVMDEVGISAASYMNKGQLEVLSFASAIFSAGFHLLRSPCFEVLSTFAKDYFSFLKAACLSQKTQVCVEIQKAGCEATSMAAKMAIDFSQSISSTSGKGLAITPDLPGGSSSIELSKFIVSMIQGLIEIGIDAANTTAPGLLNISWRAAVPLLEVESLREVATQEINIASVIATLLSLAFESLKRGVRISFLEHVDGGTSAFGLKERRQRYMVIRFFLMHAVRICQAYPYEALAVQEEIVASATSISAVLLNLTNIQPLFQVTAADISEIVAPAALGVLHALIGSSKVDSSSKVGLLTSVSARENRMNNGQDVLLEFFGKDLTHLIVVPQHCWLVGHVAVFVNLLQVSSGFGKDIVLELSRRLDWLLESLSEMPVYAMLFQSKVLAVSTTKDKDPSTHCCWQLLFTTILQALETFALVAAANSEAWQEIESFLFRNIIHRFPVCRELVLDLWCFILKNGTERLCQAHLDTLFLLFQDLSSLNCGAAYHDLLKTFARTVCRMLKAVPGSVASWLSALVFRKDTFGIKTSAVLATILLEAGLTIEKSSMSQCLRTCLDIALQDNSSLFVNSDLSTQEEALSSLFELSSQGQALQDEDVRKIADLAVGIVDRAAESPCMLSKALHYLSLRHQVNLSNIENVLSTLRDVISTVKNSNGREFKRSLAEFLSSLYDISIPEGKTDCKSQAIWELYHFVLKERHWALVHAGLASFGGFAAKTSCNELWRFVPSDAALSFDSSGMANNEDGFMTALQMFLEKESAKTSLAVTEAEFDYLNEECASLKALMEQHLETLVNSQVTTNAQPMSHSNENQVSAGMSKILEGISLLKAVWKNEERKSVVSQLPGLIAELVTLQESFLGN